MGRRFVSASTQYLSVSSTVVAANPLTMACWFMPTSVGALQVLMCQAGIAGSAKGLELRLDAAGTISATTQTSTSSTSSQVAVAGKWTHGCARFVSDVSRFAFFDGIAATENTSSKTFTGTSPFRIGAKDSAASPADALIAFPAVWNVALTDAEVLQLAQGVPPWLVRPQNLVAGWMLDSGGLVERSGFTNGYAGENRLFDLTDSGSSTASIDPPLLGDLWFGYRVPLRNLMRSMPSTAAQTVETFNSSGTWTCPAGVTSVDIECWGEGASGIGGGMVFGGNGGGAGAYAKKTAYATTPGNDYDYFIGSGGSGTDTYWGAGLEALAKRGSSFNGGSAASSVGDVKYNGGDGVVASASNGGGGGGAGGTGSAGGNGSGATGGTAGTDGGNGGNGGSGAGVNGSAGSAPGGGGGGGGQMMSTTGGAGAAGRVRLTYVASGSSPFADWAQPQSRPVELPPLSMLISPMLDAGIMAVVSQTPNTVQRACNQRMM